MIPTYTSDAKRSSPRAVCCLVLLHSCPSMDGHTPSRHCPPQVTPGSISRRRPTSIATRSFFQVRHICRISIRMLNDITLISFRSMLGIYRTAQILISVLVFLPRSSTSFLPSLVARGLHWTCLQLGIARLASILTYTLHLSRTAKHGLWTFFALLLLRNHIRRHLC